MRSDASSRAVAAVSLIAADDVRAAKRALQASLKELDRPLQRLPAWVVVGALVETTGEDQLGARPCSSFRRGAGGTGGSS